MTRSLMGAVGVALLHLVQGPGTAAPSPDRLTNQLKAAFVSKLPQFVEWPAPVLEGRSTIDVCVGPHDPFGSDLNELVTGEAVNGKPIVARQVRKEHEIDECQVLFLPRRSGGGQHPLLRRASTRPILTVSDDPSFLDDGGIIQLRVVEGRIRFDVDVTAAQRVGLRISSQILQLAVTVRGGES